MAIVVRFSALIRAASQVLSKATEYIRHLEKRNNRLIDENAQMQARIVAFEKLFMASAMNPAVSAVQQTSPMQFQHDPAYMATAPMGTPRASEPAGMIPVPEDMKRILSQQMAAGRPYPVPQQPYNPALARQQQLQQQQQQQPQQAQQRGWQSPYYGKLMVGSLAGLMILEAVRENEASSESTEGRGLSAVPVQLLSYLARSLHVSFMGYYYGPAQVIHALKLVALFGALLWLVTPIFLSQRPPKSKKSAMAQGPLEAVLSLASPIHVRRQAWLTSVQTVWVPRHNFVLEAAALVLKMIKLSVRNAIGVQGYQMLTGLTEEQEAARIKAWTIALDAQLAGGDVEINKSRLTLTFLASKTLPDTPLRLMLKALHIRVLLWELGHCSLHLGGLVNLLASKLARSMWAEARQLHRLNLQLRRRQASGPVQSSSMNNDDDELLPEHLALLLEQSCDDVLNDNVVQRAHNLAWNRPTMNGVSAAVDGMNEVVEDVAVRSPMDAVAAWWSTLTLQKTLATSLAAFTDVVDETAATPDARAATRRNMETMLDLAIRTAPVGSAAQARALVARAVLVDEHRGANIAAALQATGPLDLERRRPASPTMLTTPSSTSGLAAANPVQLTPPATPSFASAAGLRTPPPPLIDVPAAAWPWSPSQGAYSPGLGVPSAASPDVQAALRAAMAVAHLQRFPRSHHDSFRIIDEVAALGSGGLAGSGLGLGLTGGVGIPTANGSDRTGAGGADACNNAGYGHAMSLLGYTAAFRLMEALFAHHVAAERYAPSLERLAGTLRIWVGLGGTDAESVESGAILDPDVRQRLIERCLAVTKAVVGMDAADTGYGSLSEDEYALSSAC